MKFRKVAALGLAVAMAAGMTAGCGGSTDEAPAAAGAGGQTAAVSEDGKTIITIWSKDRHDAKYVQDKVDAYNQTNTDNIEVNYQLYTDNYKQAVDLAVQSGELPDILNLQD